MSVVKKGDISEVATVLAGYDRNGQLALCAEAMNEAERIRAANQEKQRQESLSQSAALRFEETPVDHDHIRQSYEETKRRRDKR